LVGASYGKASRSEVWLTGMTGMGLAFFLLSTAGVLLYFAASQLAGFYTSDAQLVSIAAPLIALTGVFIWLDSTQVVVATAVRGMGDAWPATTRHFIAFLLVMAPSAYVFIHVFAWGVTGAVYAFGLGCAASLLLQLQRFRALVRQM